ncbi:MAG TPA: sulfatase-like hydrolase/transferase [Gaiellaceae bacterium]|nr:sulfatase-like hydrolase/transferase [Gaiellaceae bacterium]
MSRPNVVWILTDEWRHDAAGYAGNAVVSTPALDALAARGTAYRNAYCESPVCQPSRASLLTCRFPSQHGKRQNAHGEFPPPEADSVVHRLRAAGYRTLQVGKTHFSWDPYDPERRRPGPPLERYGFHESAEEYDKHVLMEEEIETPYVAYLRSRGLLDAWRAHEREQTEAMFGRDPAGRAAFPEELAPEDTLDAFVGRQACERIERCAESDEPFFLWAGFVGPHPPFDAPRELAERFDPAEIPLGPVARAEPPANAYGDFIRWCIAFLGLDGYGEDDYRVMGRHYYGVLALIDEQIGRIAVTLERCGLAENTWIVVSSDHGELLGDHGLVTKAVFYEASVRVPLLVVPPRGQAHAAREERRLVQGIDAAATILELAGADTGGLAGRSLLTAAPRPVVFSEIGAFSMVATPELKLVVETETLEPQALYDLRTDPDELRDVAGDPAYADAVRELVERRLRPYAAGDLETATI